MYIPVSTQIRCEEQAKALLYNGNGPSALSRSECTLAHVSLEASVNFRASCALFPTPRTQRWYPDAILGRPHYL